ncbi:MAG TPA: sulfite exporter TauE/SafE family protein [Solirubrobacteraceae bacterium]|nr:sulfite exporter TauE/SafE family protein [Solirubrobacteraceae bacterium]
MGALEVLAILAAGVCAGTINTVVGSGTLVTFPVLLGFGYAPVVANVSNTIGLVPGSVAGAAGYRTELSGQRSRLLALGCASLSGGLSGAILLLTLPASAFKAIVPVFIVVALVLIVAQPRLTARLAKRRRDAPPHGGRWTLLAVFAAGVYGGYFGAAQGILLLAILGLSLDESLQRVNAVKIVLAGLVNLIAGVVFVLVAHVAWLPALLISIGSIAGGALGARVGRSLNPDVLRGVIVLVGVAAIGKLLL